MINCIENLSDKIFYEIFSYLDGFDIYQSFFKLNHRFKKLRDSLSYSMNIKISKMTFTDHRYKEFLQFYMDYIDSFDIHLSSQF